MADLFGNCLAFYSKSVVILIENGNPEAKVMSSSDEYSERAKSAPSVSWLNIIKLIKYNCLIWG